jgi:UDP-glucuronate 4-epimerase
MTILVTGAAGFVGFHLTKRLLDEGHSVIGFDNLNAYYEVELKQARLAVLRQQHQFQFVQGDVSDFDAVAALFSSNVFSEVIHLAAQAGVRYSLQNPQVYVQSNIMGFTQILEAARKAQVKHLIYASSSSVYGANTTMPFQVQHPTNHQVSLYGATKKANELFAHAYSHIYGLPVTGLRFFTVYGPWGRPDMAYFSFTRDILAGKTIQVFNHGQMRRDFTYVDDIVSAMVRLIPLAPQPNTSWDRANPDPSTSYAPYKVYNIGNHEPVPLLEFIKTLEELLGKKARIEFLPMQAGDVEATYADVADLARDVGFAPYTPIREGLRHFVDWYKSYYQV